MHPLAETLLDEPVVVLEQLIITINIAFIRPDVYKRQMWSAPLTRQPSPAKR